MGSYVGSWANAIEIYSHSVEKFYTPCHFGQNRSHNQGSRWKEKSNLPDEVHNQSCTEL